MVRNSTQDGEPVLHVLREHARGLAGELHGTLRRIRVRSGDIAIEVEWQPNGEPVPGSASGGPHERPADKPAPDRPDEAPGETTGADRLLVTSPMVGTFYRAPEPGADPFVEVGDTVDPGQVVGIVEAMKLMNPIVAEVGGTVAEVLVADARPVEFDQPLIALHSVT